MSYYEYNYNEYIKKFLKRKYTLSYLEQHSRKY